MAILWMDGFDHYGGLRANLLLGAYSSASAGVLVSSSSPRTGAYCLRTSSLSNSTITKVLDSAQTTLGVGFGFYAGVAMAASLQLVQFQNLSGVANASLMLNADGSISLRRGSTSGTVLFTTDPCITYGAWNHVELKIHFDNSTGYCEIRVNEVPVTIASGSSTGLDTVNTDTAACSIVSLYIENRSPSPNWAFDDFVLWNESGTQNNDFIGDRRIITLLPNANEATQEMTVTGAANAYTAIQSADGDTSYITASDSVPVTSEFALEDPGPTVGAINAVQVVTLMRKIEAGPANVQASLLSGSDASAGTNHSITDSYAYYADIHNTDPATGAPWSNSGLAAARLRLRRNT